MPAPLCWEPSSNIALYSIWHTIIEGFVAGLTLSMMFGPAFFTLLQTSLERGFKAAVRLAFGIFLSDTLLVAISFLGASRLFTDPEASKIIGLIGGAILVFIGIYTFRKKVSFQEVLEKQEEVSTPSHWTHFFKGFFTNMANPATWIFWFVSVGTISAQYTTESGDVVRFRVILFFMVTLLTVFTMDMFKSFIANRIKRFLNAKTMGKVNKVVGVLLVLFGIYLIVGSFVSFNIDTVSGKLMFQ